MILDDLTVAEQFLVNFAPALTILISMTSIAAGMLKKLAKILSNSNIDNAMENIKASKEDFKTGYEELKTLTKELMTENAELKKTQKELLKQLTKVDSGEGE